ncbi:hypothetical protein [Thalassobellus suaedae]|uniref:Uncharacterized protein n=1 Tax=Thalassobellus suaedae TaxID=3074124 RepID=A0ABY9XW00_9FLAO|nr:hypothetical protein RHP51_05125 [Flavobacteriaceae bacterium HL-DH14]
MKNFNIEIVNGRWYINGKTFPECNYIERYYFNAYLINQKTTQTA